MTSGSKNHISCLIVEREDNDAVAELLTIPSFSTELKIAEQDAVPVDLITWQVLRDDVYGHAY
ncbi:MAG: hypothetical protein AAFX01_12285 [Cyanobacteria bacterium J06638_28]